MFSQDVSAVQCDPPFYLAGLFNPSQSNDQNPAIFGDPLLKAELMSGGFFGKDKSMVTSMKMMISISSIS